MLQQHSSSTVLHVCLEKKRQCSFVQPTAPFAISTDFTQTQHSKLNRKLSARCTPTRQNWLIRNDWRRFIKCHGKRFYFPYERGNGRFQYIQSFSILSPLTVSVNSVESQCQYTQSTHSFSPLTVSIKSVHSVSIHHSQFQHTQYTHSFSTLSFSTLSPLKFQFTHSFSTLSPLEFQYTHIVSSTKNKYTILYGTLFYSATVPGHRKCLLEVSVAWLPAPSLNIVSYNTDSRQIGMAASGALSAVLWNGLSG